MNVLLMNTKNIVIMKRIIRIVFIMFFGLAFLVSCDKETNFADLTNDWKPGGTEYYLQFIDAAQSFETGVTDQGGIIDITAPIAISLLGSPQSSDVIVNLTVNAASTTIEPQMYEMSASSITIPAGQTSGSFTLTAFAEEMPSDEWLDLVLVIDAGDKNAPLGDTLKYKLKRVAFCALLDDSELAGDWTGSDSWDYPTQVVTWVDGGIGDFMINGLNVGWMEDWWGEVITDQVPLVMILYPNGTLEIEEQYYISSTWLGVPADPYSLSATGKWDNCKKEMFIDYVLHQGGEPLSYSFTENIALITK